MFKFKQSVVLILLVNICVQILGQKDAGEQCRTAGGVSGTCKFLADCPSALDEIKRGRFPPASELCGFLGTQSIICCIGGTPTSIPRPITPSPKPPTRKPSTPKPSPRPPTRTRKTTTQPTIASRGEVGEVAARMCKSYAQYAIEEHDDPGLATFSVGVISELVCPFEKEALIVGGRKSSPKEFPHMAQIGYITGTETNWACGGSLISKNFILTAAHCMENTELGIPKLIRAGMTNLTDLRDAQTRNVKNLYTHPNYTLIHKYNDIGLIEVVSNFDMNTFVRPACIFMQKDFPVKNAIASGWGRVAWAGDDSNDLLKVVLELFGNSKCNSVYRRDIVQAGSELPNGIIEDLMICAGSTDKYRDTCQGDSGGPLQIYHEDTPEIKCMYEIIGVTSFGKSCGLAKNIPGVYTRVSAYTKWIEETVWLR